MDEPDRIPWGWIIFFLLWLFCGIFGTAGKETLTFPPGTYYNP